MEYKLFRYIRHHKFKIPYFIRFIIATFFIVLSVPPIILPLFPGSLFLGVGMLIVGILLIVPGRKIRHVIKLRKSIFFLSKNLHKKHIIDHKIKDIKLHVIDILHHNGNTRRKYVKATRRRG